MTLLFVAILAGAHSMTDPLSELAQLLSQDIGVAEIAARVGPVVKHEPAPEALELRPKLKGVKEASIPRYENGDPFALNLVMQANARPTLAWLAERFGAWKELPPRFEQPRSVRFDLPSGPHWKVVLFAGMEAHVFDIDGSVKPVTLYFRRDRVKP